MDAGRFSTWLRAAAVVVVLAGGCVNLDRASPDRRFYAIRALRDGPATPALEDAVLRVEPLSISRRYEQPELVYRVSENEYESDFYHALLVPPAPMFTEEVRGWMERSGRFRQVIAPGSQATPTHALEGTIVALYGDYREPDTPFAVLEMQFFLLRLGGGEDERGPVVIFHRDYQQRVAAEGEKAADLVAAYGRALSAVLKAMDTDIGRVELFAPPGPPNPEQRLDALEGAGSD